MNAENENQNRSQAALAWAQTLDTHHKTDANALNETLLAHQINQLLESFNFEELQKNIESPKEYLDLARTILEQTSERTKRLKVELELAIYKENVTAQKQKVQEALDKPEAQVGLTPEILREIEAAMARL
jgi:hypothetical protein